MMSNGHLLWAHPALLDSACYRSGGANAGSKKSISKWANHPSRGSEALTILALGEVEAPAGEFDTHLELWSLD